jgi:hypothetical protein
LSFHPPIKKRRAVYLRLPFWFIPANSKDAGLILPIWDYTLPHEIQDSNLQQSTISLPTESVV